MELGEKRRSSLPQSIPQSAWLGFMGRGQGRKRYGTVNFSIYPLESILCLFQLERSDKSRPDD